MGQIRPHELSQAADICQSQIELGPYRMKVGDGGGPTVLTNFGDKYCCAVHRIEMFSFFRKWFPKMEQTPVDRPSLTLERLTFSDGTTVELAATDTVLLVGPNNAGKSAALKEIRANLSENSTGVVVVKADVKIVGSREDFILAISKNSKRILEHNHVKYVGLGYSIPEFLLPSFSLTNRGSVAEAFGLHVSTDSRLSSSKPAKAIDVLHESPDHPIHLLTTEPELEQIISSQFHSAFGMDLLVFRAGGASVPLMVGDLKSITYEENQFDAHYIDDVISKFEYLHRQGDGMRAFVSVLLNLVSIKTQSLLLVDEPEAFLHPPQARLLGRYISEVHTGSVQTFVATHSPDVLRGFLDNREKMPRILRLQRTENINAVRELSPTLAKQIAEDILLRTSGVYSAIFHERAIICESDADALFYSSIFELEDVSGEVRPDVLFLHGSGKQRITKLVRTCRELGVPTSAIVDIDILNDRTTFKELVESFEISWSELKSDWQIVYDSISSKRLGLSQANLVQSIKEFVRKLEEGALDGKGFLERVRELFRSSSPWEAVKKAGRSGLTGGEVTEAFDRMLVKANAAGLWILPVGELEGFCSSIAPKGPKWVESVFRSKNIANDPELEVARSFMRQVWAEGGH